MSSHNHPHTPKPGDSETIGATWLRNSTAWLDAPMGRTNGRYAGRHVTTTRGAGVILNLTTREITIGLLNPRVGEAPVTLTRGTYDWDQFVNANPGIFS